MEFIYIDCFESVERQEGKGNSWLINLAPNTTHVLSSVGTPRLFELCCKKSLTPLLHRDLITV